MIDFKDTGTVIQHTINDEMWVQFVTSKDSTVTDMLSILDEGLGTMGMERTILIQSTKGYPVPCVLIYKREGNK